MRVWVPGERRAQAVTAVDASYPTRYDRAAPSHARVLNGTALKLLTADNAPCYQDSSDNGILLSALVICTLSEADNAKFAKFNVI